MVVKQSFWRLEMDSEGERYISPLSHLGDEMNYINVAPRFGTRISMIEEDESGLPISIELTLYVENIRVKRWVVDNDSMKEYFSIRMPDWAGISYVAEQESKKVIANLFSKMIKLVEKVDE